MTAFAAWVLWVVMMISPWPIMLWQYSDVPGDKAGQLCMQEQDKDTLKYLPSFACVTFAADGTRTRESDLSAQQVVERWGI